MTFHMRLSITSSFMAPIITFVRCKAYTVMEEKKYSVVYASKELMDFIQKVHDDNESPPIRSDSRSEVIPRERSSRRFLKHFYSKK